jgi:hypothetical protein
MFTMADICASSAAVRPALCATLQTLFITCPIAVSVEEAMAIVIDLCSVGHFELVSGAYPLLLGLASAVSVGSESLVIRDHILLFYI